MVRGQIPLAARKGSDPRAPAMLLLTALPQEARMDRQGGVAVRGVTLGVVVAMLILLVRQDASVAGRDLSFNSFACPRFNPARALPVELCVSSVRQLQE